MRFSGKFVMIAHLFATPRAIVVRKCRWRGTRAVRVLHSRYVYAGLAINQDVLRQFCANLQDSYQRSDYPMENTGPQLFRIILAVKFTQQSTEIGSVCAVLTVVILPIYTGLDWSQTVWSSEYHKLVTDTLSPREERRSGQ